jgi:hypothetical protein
MSFNDVLLAYIDPGTGSIVVQMLIAGVVGVGVFFRNQIGRVFQVFRPKRNPCDGKTEPDKAKK